MKVFLFKLIDATVGAVLCWVVGRLRHFLRCEPPVPPDPAARPVRRVLVIRPGGLGDMVLLLPMLHALRDRFPAAAVDVVCERRNAAVLRLAGLADRIWCYDSAPLALLFGLRRACYDVALDSEQFHHISALMALLSRAPVRIGFKINPGRNPLYTHLITYELDGWESAQFMSLLAPLGIVGVEPVVEGCLRRAAPATPVGASLAKPAVADKRRPYEESTQLGCPSPRAEGSGHPSSRGIVIHAGATTRYKRWDRARWAELVGLLAAQTGRPIMLVGGPSDRVAAEWVARHAGGPVENMAGRLSLGETASVLARAGLFVGGDSGLAHLAVALGTPTVTLFGPSDSRKWSAPGPRHAVVRCALACAPCAIFGYHKLCHSIACMAGITVEQVAAACRGAEFGVQGEDGRDEGEHKRPTLNVEHPTSKWKSESSTFSVRC